MASRYQGLQWGTKSGDYPIVIEKLNAFKDVECSPEERRGNARINKRRAPFGYLAVCKDTLHTVTLFPDYYYAIQKQIPVMAADLFYLIDKPSVAGVAAYIQLIVNQDGSMRAKIRTNHGVYVCAYCIDDEQWHIRRKDMSKPWNW